MRELASKSQLRMSFARRALITVPLIVFLGFLMGSLSGSGEHNNWFAQLVKPSIQPPGAAFGIAWTILYVMMGFAVAMILHARGAPGRTVALCLFAFQLTLNLGWSPLFFSAHQVSAAFVLIIFILMAATVTTIAFWRVRRWAAWLMVPYLAWLIFAAVLNYRIDQLNPDAESTLPSPGRAQVIL